MTLTPPPIPPTTALAPPATRRYFGTDGIRGRVGEAPITPDVMLKLGFAIGTALQEAPRRKVLIGKDTRLSNYMFESAIEAGLAAAGMNVALLGPMPTPAVAYLTRTLHGAAGLVISASHNPHQDNGVKLFGADGMKLPDAQEAAIESALQTALDAPLTLRDPTKIGRAERIHDAPGRYIEFCKGTVSHQTDFSGLKLVVDCAHGATYHIAPHVFAELGATVHAIGVQPDGLNINLGYGSTQPAALIAAVQAHQADLGIAFDGDGDRLVIVDRHGRLYDGDDLLFVIATARQHSGHAVNAVVGTQMSNFGLEQALHRRHIALHRAAVGDRFVLEQLIQRGLQWGGENSGHLICLDKTTTGDGIISALQVLAAMTQQGRSLADLTADLVKYPQVLRNVPLSRPVALADYPQLTRAADQMTAELGARGRVLLRPSGTEPVMRVMVEADQRELAQRCALQLAQVVSECVNVAP